MKIIQIFIAILIFAAPAFGVTVRCSDEGNGIVRINYDATDEDTLPLGFALDITVDNGATIDNISDYKVGDSTAGEPGYGIFPGSMLFDDAGRLLDWGSPDVSSDGSTTGVKPGLGTNGITIEMASRYSGAENAPIKTDMLFKIHVNNHGAQSVNVNIAPNIAGGGVVLDNAAIADVTAVGCTLNYSDEPLPTNMAPVITSLTASPSSIIENQTSQLQITADDPDNGPSGPIYNWVVPAGAGSVDNAASPNPTYFPPDVTTPQTFTITAEVSDGQDMVTGNVNITVQPETTEPPVTNPDIVIITKAVYEVKPKKLRIEAMSSVQPDSTLIVEGYGKMVWKAGKNRYELSVRTADPGGSVTVTSSLGASTTQTLTLQ